MTDWRQFCRGTDGVSIDDDSLEVATGDERRHRISVRETLDTYQLTGVVVRASTVRAIPDTPLRAWRRNRATHLVGFRIDRKGRLVGEAWVPKAGLRREEFLLYLRRVAAECDLFEFTLTGVDRE